MANLLKLLIIVVLILVIGGTFFVFWSDSQTKKDAPLEPAIPKIMKILSPVFENNSKIPSKYTCDGQNINPPLEIRDVPEGAESLVLIVDDPDAPIGTFLHWLIFDIQPQTSFIKENSIPKGAIQGKNDFGKESYGGPCPPSNQHRYFFKLYALDKKLNLPQGAKLKEVEDAMKNHILDKAQLIGLYQRK